VHQAIPIFLRIGAWKRNRESRRRIRRIGERALWQERRVNPSV
jgi:hypothetical protein